MNGIEEAKLHRTRGKRRFDRAFPIVVVACLVLVCRLPIRAADPATIIFSLDFPHSDPDHYSIVAQSDGHAHYDCSAKISDESEDRETYQADFTLSDATRARIFDLAAQSHYFSGKVDSGNRKLAFTGTKKLTYKDAQHETTAAYNFSQVPVVQQLTTLFQSISATLEFGRRLAHDRRYQKLALDDELKRMEDQARRGDLIELQAVKPILQGLRDDGSLMNIVRARAQRIMDMGNAVPATH